MATYAQRALRRASFCGVPFNVKSTSIKVGRRTALFEYPQRDKPFVEDLGRSARVVTLTAFVTGIDYVQQMGALIAKLEEKGTGELVDPWLGRMRVTAQNTSEVKYSSKLCYAEVTISFIETGDLVFPNSSVSTATAVRSCANALRDAACSCLAEVWPLDGAQDFVLSALAGRLNDVLQIDAISTVANMFGCSDLLSDLATDAVSLLGGSAETFAYRLADALGLGGWATSAAAWRRVAHLASSISSKDELNEKNSILYASSTTDYQEATASEAIDDAVRQIELSNAVGAAANIGTDLDRVSTSSAAAATAYDDLIMSRDEILKAIDAEMLKTDSDVVYSALESARAAVWEDLTTRAEDKAKLVTVTPPTVMPALVIAYDFYGDATRELEIVERNRIRRSAFVPPRPLKLLST